LNLIRVMPAKGQDMPTSIFLAKLMGPVFLAIGVGLILNGAAFRELTQEFLDSYALIFLSGLIILPAGLAIVLTHNVWTRDWRPLITILGWLLLIGGAVRLAAPQQAAAIARVMFDSPVTMNISTGITGVIGVLLCFFGYIQR
jgi:hypothetical protein